MEKELLPTIKKNNSNSLSNYLKISIVLFVLFLAFLIISFLFPFVLKTYLHRRYSKQSYYTVENSGDWTGSPGNYLKDINHIINFFEIKDSSNNSDDSDKNNYENTYKVYFNIDDVEIQEIESYKNIQYSGKTFDVSYDSNLDYYVKNSAGFEISHINHELIEVISLTTANKDYVKSLNAVHLAIKDNYLKVNPIIKLFTYYFYSNIIKFIIDDFNNAKKQLFKNWLDSINKDIFDKVMNKNQKIYLNYSFTTMSGLSKWMDLLILNNYNKLNLPAFVTEKFNLSSNELEKMFGDTSYIRQIYNCFMLELSIKENYLNIKEPYEQRDISDLTIKQLFESNILNLLYPNITTYKKLTQEMGLYYPYKKSPELSVYFNEEFKQYKKNLKFEDVNLTSLQRSLYFSIDSKNKKYSLFEAENIIKLLNFNFGNVYNAYEELKIRSLEQLEFLTGYIYYYLPKNFINYNFKFKNTVNINNTNNNIVYNDLTYGITNLSFEVINKSISTIYYNVYYIILYKYLYNSSVNLNKNYCFDFIKDSNSKSTDEEINKLCNKEKLSLNNEDSSKFWISLVESCNDLYNTNENNINNNDYNSNKNCYLKEEVIKYFEDNNIDVNNILKDNSKFKEFIKEINNKINKKYCNGSECSKYNLTKLQWIDSKITNDPLITLNNIETNTDCLYYWDNKLVPFKSELKYVLKNKEFNTKDNIFELVFKYITNNSEFYELFTSYQHDMFFITNKSNKNYYLEIEFLKFFNDINDLNVFKQYIVKSISTSNKNNNIYLSTYRMIDLIQGIEANKESFYYLGDSKLGFMSYNKYMNLIFEFSKEYKDSPKNKFTKVTGDSEFYPDSIGNIKAINGKDIFNTYSKILNIGDKSVYAYYPFYLNTKQTPISYKKIDFNDDYIINSYEFSPKYKRINTNKPYNSILFYDIISSRLLKFNYSNTKKLPSGIYCENYILNSNDIVQELFEQNYVYDSGIFSKNKKFASVYHKFNKPYVITASNEYSNLKDYFVNIDENEDIFLKNNKENYLCVDPYTFKIINAEINLLYSLDPTSFNVLTNNNLDSKLLPLWNYKLKYNLSYDILLHSYPLLRKIPRAAYIVFVLFLTLASLAFVGFLIFIIIYKLKSNKLSKRNINDNHYINQEQEKETIQNSSKLISYKNTVTYMSKDKINNTLDIDLYKD